MNLPVLPKYQITTATRKMKKSCELKLVESTTLSQRLIHGDVCTEVSKKPLWRIPASDCYGAFSVVIFF